MRSQPRVVVVVLAYNSNDVLAECLDSLCQSTYENMDVVVVDNASQDKTVQWLAEGHPDIHLVRNEKNLGWAGGNNVGIRYGLESSAEYLWLLNPDVSVEPDCVTHLVRTADQNLDAGLFSPLIHYYGNKKDVWFAGGRINCDEIELSHVDAISDFETLPARERYICGCAMFIRASVVRRLGLIDERYFMYCEDADYSLKVSESGIGLSIVDEARIYHKVSTSTGGLSASNTPLQAYYILRSEMLFWRKHLGWIGFHREYCPRHLAKWVDSLSADVRQEGEAREQAYAVMDAFWYVLTLRRCPERRVPSPAWFRNVMLKKPWIIPEIMSLHIWSIITSFVRKRT